MKRRTKFTLAAAAAIVALGFLSFRLYIPHSTTGAVSKFGSAGASALKSGGRITCRRVFALTHWEIGELEEKSLPIPQTTFSPWVELQGSEREAVRTELSEQAERFVNFATSCRFHPDIELVVHDAAGSPAFNVTLCYSCDKWRASTGTHGRFPESGALHDLVLTHPLELGWYRPRGQPPEQTVTAFGPDAASALLNPLNEIRVRVVNAPKPWEISDAIKLGFAPRPEVYGDWSQLGPEDAHAIRSALLQNFGIWGESRPACTYHPDIQIEWFDEDCRPAGTVTLCHTCGIWMGQDKSGMFSTSLTKDVMLRVFPETAATLKH